MESFVSGADFSAVGWYRVVCWEGEGRYPAPCRLTRKAMAPTHGVRNMQGM